MSIKSFRFVFALVLGASGIGLAPVQAQPDINNAPKADNPPNWNWNPGGGGRRGGVRQPLTAEQLRQMRTGQAEMRALNIRQQLTMAGYTDAAVQTAIVDYYKAQDAAQTSLLEQWQKIGQAVQAKNVADTEMATMLNDFRAAVDKEKERRETAYKTLSTTIELPKKPMLDALLMTMGLVGDEAAVVGQANGGGLAGLLNILGGPGGMGNIMGGGGNFAIRGGVARGQAGPGGQGDPGGPNGGRDVFFF